jgi:prepilin-type N-terminal cleavage/methylation domain-containing protein
MSRQNGFSLIELLVVVAIILIIAGIAIPNLLRSRIAANEASAVGSVRTINTAQVTYALTYPANGFATALTQLGPASVGSNTSNSTNANLLDYVLAQGTKSGYTFLIGNTSGVPVVSTYAVNASPISSQTGKRCFYSDASGVIRYNTSTSATSTDSALQ